MAYLLAHRLDGPLGPKRFLIIPCIGWLQGGVKSFV
jgi:hypothetical protein